MDDSYSSGRVARGYLGSGHVTRLFLIRHSASHATGAIPNWEYSFQQTGIRLCFLQ
jgi:hypothetical protein